MAINIIVRFGGFSSTAEASIVERGAGDISIQTVDAARTAGKGATGRRAVAFGKNTLASGENSFAEGEGTTAFSSRAHAEGVYSTASGNNSHAEGQGTVASGNNSHAEGYLCEAIGSYSHVEGSNNKAQVSGAHAEGNNNIVTGISAHAEGNQHNVSGEYSHAEGSGNTVSGSAAHAEGTSNTASGEDSHAEGNNVQATGKRAHAEGGFTKATAQESHAEGHGCTASGQYSHAGGNGSIASGNAAFAQGQGCTAAGEYSVALGNSNQTTPDGDSSFVAGLDSTAQHHGACVLGGSLRSSREYQTTVGDHNVVDPKAMFIVAHNNKNLFTVKEDGSLYGVWGRVGEDYPLTIKLRRNAGGIRENNWALTFEYIKNSDISFDDCVPVLLWRVRSNYTTHGVGRGRSTVKWRQANRLFAQSYPQYYNPTLAASTFIDPAGVSCGGLTFISDLLPLTPQALYTRIKNAYLKNGKIKIGSTKTNAGVIAGRQLWVHFKIVFVRKLTAITDSTILKQFHNVSYPYPKGMQVSNAVDFDLRVDSSNNLATFHFL